MANTSPDNLRQADRNVRAAAAVLKQIKRDPLVRVRTNLTWLIGMAGLAIALLLAQMWLLWTILARLDRSP